MRYKREKTYLFSCILCLITTSLLAHETQTADILERLFKTEKALATQEKSQSNQIKIGGVARVNYSHTDYVSNADNQHRSGDFDFDMLRLDVDGKKDALLVSAQIRFFQYMYALRHAWIGYDFGKESQLQIGMVPMPFGIMPYNSNNFFFSANYYIGFEDTHAMGLHWQYKAERFDLDLGFYKNDDMGGVDGFVDNRNKSYTYSIVGTGGLDANNEPRIALAENNTFSVRSALKVLKNENNSVELGLSGLYGDIVDVNKSAGRRYSYALHALVDIGDLNIKLQALKYAIDLDNAYQEVSVGAYAWNDLIATHTTSYTAHLAYKIKVEVGPLSEIKMYNDYSVLTDKSGGLEDTVMNATGMMLTAGYVYTYIDFFRAKNMPFIGGSMTGDTKDWNNRINVNIGYYF